MVKKTTPDTPDEQPEPPRDPHKHDFAFTDAEAVRRMIEERREAS